MAAPKKNEFWKMRSKHGRDRLFKTPQALWKACEEYFQWCTDNPLIEVDWVGSGGRRVNKPKMRAFTIQGLCGYLNCNTVYFNHFESSLQEENKKDDPLIKDFSKVCTRIRDVIYQQKFEGASAGFLNPTIIARDLGLRDKQELSGPGGGPLQIQQITGMEIK